MLLEAVPAFLLSVLRDHNAPSEGRVAALESGCSSASHLGGWGPRSVSSFPVRLGDEVSAQ